ncbi:MAG: hypothetical protein EOL87_07315 [Spartobacteria bacterium]|nr:hypothetical protein [Spartobacteria bacterium]
MAKQYGMQKCKDYDISGLAMGLALSESKKDVEMMRNRRRNDKGYARSKIAGILTFRLIKHHPVQVFGENLVMPEMTLINAAAAVELCFKHIMNFEFPRMKNLQRQSMIDELMYVAVYRHSNQETFALVYDALDFHNIAKQERM